MLIETPKIETRDESLLVQALRRRLRAYVENWRPGERGADAAMLWIFARYLDTIGKRLNLAPDKNLLAFLEMAGVRRIPPQSARAPMVFALNELAENGRILEGTRLAAPPTPERADQLVFETERNIGLAAARIKEIACLNPGRDEFASYFSALQSGQAFQLFTGMQKTEHSLYLAHNRLLEMAGTVNLKVDFDLAQTSRERLKLLWEYWDGEVWRAFANVLEQCGGALREDLDGTDGLTRSGSVTLKSDCAENQRREVNGVNAFWIRGSLLDPLPVDPAQTLPAVDSVKLRTELSDPLILGGEIENFDTDFRTSDDPYVKGRIFDLSNRSVSNITVYVIAQGKAGGSLTELIIASGTTDSSGRYQVSFKLTKIATTELDLTVALKSIPNITYTNTISVNQFLQIDFRLDVAKVNPAVMRDLTVFRNLDEGFVKGRITYTNLSNEELALFNGKLPPLQGVPVEVSTIGRDKVGNKTEEINIRPGVRTNDEGQYEVRYKLTNLATTRLQKTVALQGISKAIYITPNDIPTNQFLQVDFLVDFSKVIVQEGEPEVKDRDVREETFPYVTGIISDADGNAIQGLWISVTIKFGPDEDDIDIRTTITDAQGLYKVVFENWDVLSWKSPKITVKLVGVPHQYKTTSVGVKKFFETEFLQNNFLLDISELSGLPDATRILTDFKTALDRYVKGRVIDQEGNRLQNLFINVTAKGKDKKNNDRPTQDSITTSVTTDADGQYEMAFTLVDGKTTHLDFTVEPNTFQYNGLPNRIYQRDDVPRDQSLVIDFLVDTIAVKVTEDNVGTAAIVTNGNYVKGKIVDQTNGRLNGISILVTAQGKTIDGRPTNDRLSTTQKTDVDGRYDVIFPINDKTTAAFEFFVKLMLYGAVTELRKDNVPVNQFLQVDFLADFAAVTGNFLFPIIGTRVLDDSHVRGKVIDQNDIPLQGIALDIEAVPTNQTENRQIQRVTTNALGEYEVFFRFQSDATTQLNYTVKLAMGSLIMQHAEERVDISKFLQVDFRLTIQAPTTFDKAFSSGEKVDLDKTFYPFGQQPQPGNAFYFNSDAIFSKPNAIIQIFFQRINSPQDETAVKNLPASNVTTPRGQTTIIESEPLKHSIKWEYWNGRRWAGLALADPQPDLDTTGVIIVRIPDDFERTKVNDEEAYWMRVRLVGGGFGFRQHVTWLDQRGNANEFIYVIDQPPVLSTFRFGFFWQSPPEFPEHVLTLNDFSYADHTNDNRVPAVTFPPFVQLADQTPGTYLGFDKKLPVDFISLFCHIEEEREGDPAPVLEWEYWNGASWQHLTIEDETGHLSRPGMLSFIGPDDAETLARFGAPLYWIRGRRREDGTPFQSLVQGIFLNGVWASQRQTQRNEPLGASNGSDNQVFRLRQTPVLENEVIEVRELAGKIAEVEYPLLQESIAADDLRAVRDVNNRVIEVWVRWRAVEHFHFSGANDRHYVMDRVLGRIFFGDGEKGKVPPAGSLILGREYRAGGGRAGNVPLRAIAQLVGGVPGVQEVYNALPAEGGADAEKIEQIQSRGPQTIRHRGRGVLVQDYEVMAAEASPEVAWVRIFATTDMKQVRRPGYVKVMILPDSTARRPWPSFGLRERVRRYLQERAPAAIAPENFIWVTGPAFFPIDVETTAIPLHVGEAGIVEQRIRAALEEFLHPLRGGPNGMGWELGRDVFLSDVAAKIERLAGVDFVEAITLMRAGVPQGERVAVPDDQLVVAGNIRVKMKLI